MKRKAQVKIAHGLVATIMLAIIICLALIVFLPLQGDKEQPQEQLPQGGDNQEHWEIPENAQDFFKEMLATERGVLEENVEIYYCRQITALEMENTFAVYAVVSGNESLVFLYDAATRTVTENENSYLAATDDERQALFVMAETISPWTGNRIVPCDLTKVDNAYDFKYYDGYYAFTGWSVGWATLYLDNRTVEWGIHI